VTEHDEPMDFLVTDDEIIYFNNRSAAYSCDESRRGKKGD